MERGLVYTCVAHIDHSLTYCAVGKDDALCHLLFQRTEFEYKGCTRFVNRFRFSLTLLVLRGRLMMYTTDFIF
jgi:hypothetical protein